MTLQELQEELLFAIVFPEDLPNPLIEINAQLSRVDARFSSVTLSFADEEQDFTIDQGPGLGGELRDSDVTIADIPVRIDEGPQPHDPVTAFWFACDVRFRFLQLGGLRQELITEVVTSIATCNTDPS